MRNICLWLKIEDRDSRRKQSRVCCQSTQTPDFQLGRREEEAMLELTFFCEMPEKARGIGSRKIITFTTEKRVFFYLEE